MAKNGNGRAPLAEWRGSVTATLGTVTEQIGTLSASIKELTDRVDGVEKAQAVVATKIAVYGGLAGSIVGGGAHYLLKALGL